MLPASQSFITRQECEKVAFQNGFRRPLGEANGWRRYASTTAQGSIWLAVKAEGTWLLALDHAGVATELDLVAAELDGPGHIRYQFTELAGLYQVLPRIYELAVSLPDAPYKEFQKRTRGLPNSTEAERLVIQRIGQDIFRDRLLQYWKGRCPLTGISDKSLLRASHIKPWRQCGGDEERLDVHNGILLSALWDAAFDTGLVSFTRQGEPLYSPELSREAESALKASLTTPKLSVTQFHSGNLEWHRANLFAHPSKGGTGSG